MTILNRSIALKYATPLFPIPTSLKHSGKLKQKIRCVLFDIYGTLFISGSGDISVAKKESQQIEKLETLLIKFGISKSPKKVLDGLFNTIEETHVSLRKKGIDFPEVVIEQIWMRVLENDDFSTVRAFAIEFELIANPVYPMPHLKKMLSNCKELNVLMGIISNAQFYTPYLFNWFLDSSPEALGFDPDLTLYSYQFGYAKPSTFMFKMAAEKLKHRHIPPPSVLYMGNDILNDIYPAKKIGFSTALFAGDARSLRLREDDPKCKNLSADLIITDLDQILDYIER